MKKSILTIITLTILAFTTKAQIKVDPANPDIIHNKINELILKSENVVLNDSIYNKLVLFAQKNNLSKNLPIRNLYVFKILLNEKLSIEERLYACDYFYITNNNALPGFVQMDMIEEIEKKLLTRYNKNN